MKQSQLEIYLKKRPIKIRTKTKEEVPVVLVLCS